MAKKLTQEEAEARLKTLAPEFIYPPFIYKGSAAPIKAICPIHGEFITSIDKITAGYRCPKCGMDRLIKKNKSVRPPEVLSNLVKERFKDRPLDFSESEFKGSRDEIVFKCELHGYKKSIPIYLLRNIYGCDECARIEAHNTKRETFEEFVEKSRNAHPDVEYDYSFVNLLDCDTPVEIVCPKGHHFWQTPYNHYNGADCTICKESKGERRIALWLDNHNISYTRQHRINPLKYVLFGRNKFKVDFFLPDFNIIIEFHGKQHYIRVESWHTEEEFQNQQDRDRRLRDYCKKNGIKLIEIPYTKLKEIDKILDKKIGRLK